MKTKRSEKQQVTAFVIGLVLILACLGAALIETRVYNAKERSLTVSGTELFAPEASARDGAEIVLSTTARSDTWTKIFDPENEGLTEPNYRAYIYDIGVENVSRSELYRYTFTYTFSVPVYLSSAWNGSMEIRQHADGQEYTARIDDLRDYDAASTTLRTVVFDGETLIPLAAGDGFTYYPSTASNAVEMPLEAGTGTTPGLILYTALDETIDGSRMTIDYVLHKRLLTNPLVAAAGVGFFLWIILLINAVITQARLRFYEERHERDNRIIVESIDTFISFIDAKDPYTNGHSRRVAQYTKLIAGRLGYSGDELERIYYVALLHDCGKIGIPDNILGKPGRLTDEEYEIIKSHTVKGNEILQNFSSVRDVTQGALYHHEHYDGSGYPEGRAGTDIPQIARIICAADSFDAMNSDRCYRRKLSREQIIAELEKNSGTQFDPEIDAIMLNLIREDAVIV